MINHSLRTLVWGLWVWRWNISLFIEVLAESHQDSIVVELLLRICKVRNVISRSCQTQDIMNSFDFWCDVPHQWIAQEQVCPVSVYADLMGYYMCCCCCMTLKWNVLCKRIHLLDCDPDNDLYSNLDLDPDKFFSL